MTQVAQLEEQLETMTNKSKDEHMFRGWPAWSAQVNDLVGGWIVTTYPYPASDHVFNDIDSLKHGYIIAECMMEEDARRIAQLLNEERYVPKIDDEIAKQYRWVRTGFLAGTLRLSLYDEDYIL